MKITGIILTIGVIGCIVGIYIKVANDPNGSIAKYSPKPTTQDSTRSCIDHFGAYTIHRHFGAIPKNSYTDSELQTFRKVEDDVRNQLNKELQLYRFDANKSGIIDPTEQKEIDAYNVTIGERVNAVFIELYDVDNDGKVNSHEETTRNQDIQLLLQKLREEDLNRYDKNKDGVISDGELEFMKNDQYKRFKNKDIIDYLILRFREVNRQRKMGELGV